MDLSNQTFYLEMIHWYTSKGNSFDYFIKYKNSNFIIPIAMSLDDTYIYTIIIEITSIMENWYKSTNYEFYIMYSPDFHWKIQLNLKNCEKNITDVRLI